MARQGDVGDDKGVRRRHMQRLVRQALVRCTLGVGCIHGKKVVGHVIDRCGGGYTVRARTALLRNQDSFRLSSKMNGFVDETSRTTGHSLRK
jgi:hypothetical protein